MKLPLAASSRQPRKQSAARPHWRTSQWRISPVFIFFSAPCDLRVEAGVGALIGQRRAVGIIVEACVELVGRRSRRLCSVNPGSTREIAGCRIAEVDAQEQRARAVAFAALADCCVRASWRCLAWGSQCMRIRKLESGGPGICGVHRTDCSRRASEIRMGALRGCWAAGVPRGLGPARCITGPRRQECDSEPAGSLAGTAGIFRRATHATTAPSPRSVRRSAVAAARWAPRPQAM